MLENDRTRHTLLTKHTGEISSGDQVLCNAMQF